MNDTPHLTGHGPLLQEEFKLLVESVKDYAIFMLDPEGRIVSWNEGARRIKGYQAEDIIGHHFSRFYPEEDVRAGRPQAELKVAASAGRMEDEGWRVRKDGSRFWANVIISAVRNSRGELIGFSKISRDMTQRKRMEEELLAARLSAENSSRELEAFAYSVAHDLRSPLRALDGFSKVLLVRYADRLDEEGKDFLQRVRENSVQMGRLIDDLLALSRVTRGIMHRERVDLSAMVSEIAARLRNVSPERSAEFAIAQGLWAEGDPGLLRLALENLLGNAWKYTSKHPSARIEFGAERKAGRTVYFVRDDGAGFDMAFAKMLFKPFNRLHRTTEFEGTGIGLATVQRVISRHGGQIGAEGQVERGATFYFTLWEEIDEEADFAGGGQSSRRKAHLDVAQGQWDRQ